ncbi:fibronectin type III domain-containing protein [Flavobacterium artemisiae]|uniref:Fibronectin type III domain-containing protein n=1 Tax=Flavobacterium artemisiae TaxID=2126556 RepID=A0ABW4HHM1_9FLAO
MKQVNFTHAGGFPLEQETLERLQTAYRSELYEAIKKHLSIETNVNYIVAPATPNTKGWAIIHQDETDENGNAVGILYPIKKKTPTSYLKTTRKSTNLIYGDGSSQTAYYDYEAEYVDAMGNPYADDIEIVIYYNLAGFETVKDIKAIETILDSIDANIKAIKTNITNVEGNIESIENEINTINQTYLPINGSKAMEGDLKLGNHHLYLRNNLNIGNSNNFLSINNESQVVVNNTIIQTLIDKVTDLERKTATSTAFPIGMVAIWGKPAPIPEGWEEYIPLRGKMPVGLYNPSQNERVVQIGQKNYYQNLTYYYNENGDLVWPFETLGDEGGHVAKNLSIDEMPKHSHGLGLGTGGANSDGGSDFVKNSTTGTTFTTKETGIGKAFPLMSPYRVVQFIEYKGTTSDTTSPRNLTATNISSTTLTLSWDAPTDFSGVTNYLLYKDGSHVETLSNVTTYNVKSLTSGVKYNFYVIAKNAAGNLSGTSNKIDVTTILDAASPTAPTITDYSVETNYITFSWSASTDDVGVAEYVVYRRTYNGDVSESYLGTPDNFCTVFGSFNTIYYFRVRAKDATGKLSAYSNEITVAMGSGGSSGGGGCFDIESLVTMASGQSKKLKNIVAGDKLHGLTFPNEIDESDGDYMLWNGKLSEAAKAEVTVVNKRTSIQPNYFEIKTADNTIKVTGLHPLLITEDGENLRWVCTKNVVETMFLIDKTGKTKAIESITFKEEPLEVALLDVEDVDNYIISGITAHNNKEEIEPNP